MGSQCVLGTLTALAFRCGDGGLIATQSPTDPLEDDTSAIEDEISSSKVSQQHYKYLEYIMYYMIRQLEVIMCL